MRAVVPFVLLIAACAAEPAPSPPPERDPATVQALNDQIMIDPDLANQNEGNAALTVPSDHSLPLPIATAEAIAAARAEAAAIVGGSGEVVAPPAPRPLAGVNRGRVVALEERVAALPGAEHCAGLATRSASWAARFPQALPIYPRGAVQAAAGADGEGCALRVVGFVTPVPLEDVLAFYAARARQAGFPLAHAAGGGVHRLAGRKGAAAFALELETDEDGLTRADLALVGL